MRRFFTLAGVALLASCSAQPVAAEGERSRYDVTDYAPVVVDRATGCEYFVIGGRAITPRYERAPGYPQHSRVRGCR